LSPSHLGSGAGLESRVGCGDEVVFKHPGLVPETTLSSVAQRWLRGWSWLDYKGTPPTICYRLLDGCGGSRVAHNTRLEGSCPPRRTCVANVCDPRSLNAVSSHPELVGDRDEVASSIDAVVFSHPRLVTGMTLPRATQSWSWHEVVPSQPRVGCGVLSHPGLAARSVLVGCGTELSLAAQGWLRGQSCPEPPRVARGTELSWAVQGWLRVASRQDKLLSMT
jgi:hypothetical protein